MPVTLHVGNLKVIVITLKCKQNFKHNEKQKLAFFTDNKRWTLSSVIRKKSVSVMEHSLYQGKVSRLFAFFTVHNNKNDITTCILYKYYIP